MGLFSKIFGSRAPAVEEKQTDKAVREVPPISSEDCAMLQRWGQVAFSARCARRVQPIYTAALGDQSQDHVHNVNEAISIAEQACSLATSPNINLSDVLETILVAEKATGATDLPNSPMTSAHFAIAVLWIVRNTIELIDSPNPLQTSSSANFAAAACGYINNSPQDIIPLSCRIAIWEDFDTLRKYVENSDASNDIPFPLNIFGPLWVNGTPEGWPTYIAIDTHSTPKDNTGAELDQKDSIQNPSNLFENGKELLESGDLLAGMEKFRNALEASPNIADQIFNLAFAMHGAAASKNKIAGGNIYYSDGFVELDTAIAIMKLLSEFEPNKADIWLQLGVAYDNRCEFEKAIKVYEKAFAIDSEGPDGADASRNLGILYFNMGKGILGVKQNDLNEHYGFNPANEHFYKAEAVALQAVEIGIKAFKHDISYRAELINAHRLVREIYSVFVKETENGDGSMLHGTKALEHCLAIYKLNPNDEDAVSWLKQAENNTGENYIIPGDSQKISNSTEIESQDKIQGRGKVKGISPPRFAIVTIQLCMVKLDTLVQWAVPDNTFPNKYRTVIENTAISEMENLISKNPQMKNYSIKVVEALEHPVDSCAEHFSEATKIAIQKAIQQLEK